MGMEEMVRRVESYRCRQVVVTGGEPLRAEELGELLERLKESGKFLTVETNATRYRRITCDLISISPKLANCGQKDKARRLNVEAIGEFIAEHDYQLKFVVEAESDLEEVEEILSGLGRVERNKVMLMPQARTQEEYHRRAPQVAQWCIEKGFRFSPRLQVELWGRRRKK